MVDAGRKGCDGRKGAIAAPPGDWSPAAVGLLVPCQLPFPAAAAALTVPASAPPLGALGFCARGQWAGGSARPHTALAVARCGPGLVSRAADGAALLGFLGRLWIAVDELGGRDAPQAMAFAAWLGDMQRPAARETGLFCSAYHRRGQMPAQPSRRGLRHAQAFETLVGGWHLHGCCEEFGRNSRYSAHERAASSRLGIARSICCHSATHAGSGGGGGGAAAACAAICAASNAPRPPTLWLGSPCAAVLPCAYDPPPERERQERVTPGPGRALLPTRARCPMLSG